MIKIFIKSFLIMAFLCIISSITSVMLELPSWFNLASGLLTGVLTSILYTIPEIDKFINNKEK